MRSHECERLEFGHLMIGPGSDVAQALHLCGTDALGVCLRSHECERGTHECVRHSAQVWWDRVVLLE